MDKVAKIYLNSIRCPICSGLLDTTEGNKAVKEFNYCCVYDAEHFGIYLVTWEFPIRLEVEQTIVYYGKNKFFVKQRYYDEGILKPHTVITIKEIDPENRVIDGAEVKTFKYDKHLFDFKIARKDKIINRIKTILVFQ